MTPQSCVQAQWRQTLNARPSRARTASKYAHAMWSCVIQAPTRGRAKGRGRARTRASMSLCACQPHQPTREPRMMPATVSRPADCVAPAKAPERACAPSQSPVACGVACAALCPSVSRERSMGALTGLAGNPWVTPYGSQRRRSILLPSKHPRLRPKPSGGGHRALTGHTWT